MKPFDIELAKAGHPVCTRDMRAVRILCYDFISLENTPIIGLVKLSEKQEGLSYYKVNGMLLECGDHNLDLMMAPVKKEGWINLYRNGEKVYTNSAIVHSSEKDAVECRLRGAYMCTVKIEWDEPL
jgi:hypothetical protein